MQTYRPRFERYIGENDPLFHAYLKKSIAELLEDINNQRSVLIDFVTVLEEDQLQLKGIHPKYGSLTITQWTEFFLLHEAHPLWTILQLISAFRSPEQE